MFWVVTPPMMKLKRYSFHTKIRLKMKAAISPGRTCGSTTLKMTWNQEPPLTMPVSSKRVETPSRKPFRIQTEKGIENIA